MKAERYVVRSGNFEEVYATNCFASAVTVFNAVAHSGEGALLCELNVDRWIEMERVILAEQLAHGV